MRLNQNESDVVINWSGGLHHAKKSEASGTSPHGVWDDHEVSLRILLCQRLCVGYSRAVETPPARIVH